MTGKAERETKTKRGRKRDRDSGRQRIMEGVINEQRETEKDTEEEGTSSKLMSR